MVQANILEVVIFVEGHGLGDFLLSSSVVHCTWYWWFRLWGGQVRYIIRVLMVGRVEML